MLDELNRTKLEAFDEILKNWGVYSSTRAGPLNRCDRRRMRII